MYFDPAYFIFLAPALILSFFAQMWVKSAFNKYSQIPNRNRITGAEAAAQILRKEGIDDVRIEMTKGFLGDHYDPRHKVLRLSHDVYSSYSLAAVGVAAHEVGHAVQHARQYGPLKLRSLLVPVAQIGSNLAWPLLLIGFLLQMSGLIQFGIILFSAAVLFQLVTLPVEFNASRRAMVTLSGGGILAYDELHGARKVLNAAAMTYVAAAVAAISQLLYFLFRAGLLRRND